MKEGRKEAAYDIYFGELNVFEAKERVSRFD